MGTDKVTPEKIDIGQYYKTVSHREDVIPFFYIKALCKATKSEQEELHRLYKENNGIANISLVFDGIQIPFEETIRELFADIERIIDKRAYEKYEEKFNIIDELFYNLKKKLKEEFQLEEDDL